MTWTTAHTTTLHPAALFKLAPGQVDLARQAAKDHAVDQVFIQHGTDIYLAAGRNLHLRAIRAPMPIPFTDEQGRQQTGTVLQVHDHLNSFSDAFRCRSSVRPAVTIGAVTGGLYSLAHGTNAVMGEVFMGGLAARAGTWGGIVGRSAGAGLVVGALFAGTAFCVAGLVGAMRPTTGDMASLKALYAEPRQRARE